jgi:hypothetical protein
VDVSGIDSIAKNGELPREHIECVEWKRDRRDEMSGSRSGRCIVIAMIRRATVIRAVPSVNMEGGRGIPIILREATGGTGDDLVRGDIDRTAGGGKHSKKYPALGQNGMLASMPMRRTECKQAVLRGARNYDTRI